MKRQGNKQEMHILVGESDPSRLSNSVVQVFPDHHLHFSQNDNFTNTTKNQRLHQCARHLKMLLLVDSKNT